MDLKQAANRIDSENIAVNEYALGYTAYLDRNGDDTLHVSFHKGDMPAHASFNFRDAAHAAEFFYDNTLMENNGWELTDRS